MPNEETLRARGVVNVRELIRFELEGLSVSLPAHKRILGYDISLTALPRTTTGKLRRKEIERLARQRGSHQRRAVRSRRTNARGSRRAITRRSRHPLPRG